MDADWLEIIEERLPFEIDMLFGTFTRNSKTVLPTQWCKTLLRTRLPYSVATSLNFWLSGLPQQSLTTITRFQIGGSTTPSSKRSMTRLRI